MSELPRQPAREPVPSTAVVGPFAEPALDVENRSPCDSRSPYAGVPGPWPATNHSTTHPTGYPPHYSPVRPGRDAVDELLRDPVTAPLVTAGEATTGSPLPPAAPVAATAGSGAAFATRDRAGAPVQRLTRSRSGRIMGGVSAGIADHLHVQVVWVRVTFCLLALLTGVGVLAYALLWIFVPQSDRPEVAAPTANERKQAVGIAAIGAALAVLGTAFGLGQSIGWIIGPLGLAAVGGAFIWREADDAQRQKWRRSAAGVVGDGNSGLWRVLGGAVLVVGGLAVFALGQFNFSATGGALLAVVLTLIGVAIIAIPWWVKLVRDLGAERRELVVQQERSEIAAHLHDSVLQTLALIQRQAADPREVLRLSRSQERELRAWLYGPAGYATAASTDEAIKAATVAVALATAAGEVEDTYAVKVTPVVVGDTPMDSDMTALVAASREAMVNAAKHAGNPDISVYAEVEDDAVTVFVRDRGVGFDQSQVGSDRRGLAESVRGRMDRHRGRATIRSTPGEGTEVELRMPISGRTPDPLDPAAPQPAERHSDHR